MYNGMTNLQKHTQYSGESTTTRVENPPDTCTVEPRNQGHRRDCEKLSSILRWSYFSGPSLCIEWAQGLEQLSLIPRLSLFLRWSQRQVSLYLVFGKMSDSPTMSFSSCGMSLKIRLKSSLRDLYVGLRTCNKSASSAIHRNGTERLRLGYCSVVTGCSLSIQMAAISIVSLS